MKYVPPLGSVDPDAAYQNGNPSAGIPGSIVPAAAIEHPQRELLHVILKAGLTPDENTLTQLYEAIVKIVGVEVPLASVMEAGLVKIGDGLQIGEDGTLSVKSSDLLEDWRKSWIGVPRYWRSTVLPDDHCWANGDFVSFSNWPELHAVYEAGGLEGMLLGWDATEEEQAANLGKWRPDSSIPTGLYTPALSGQFFRNWGYGQIEKPGGINEAGIPNILAINGQEQYSVNDAYGAFFVKKNTSAFHHVANGDGQNAEPSHYIGMFDASNCSSVYGSSTTVMPPSINQPVCLYLGRPAQV
ncbi:hypothetical protein [Desulfovibrio piger]|uniref:hypothetical protein n=1 Tax=Desulfovibrio piger TaxID=901 RepID=UPI0026EA2D07|nr:hypothetical protein [Desulfovibrio piger]